MRNCESVSLNVQRNRQSMGSVPNMGIYHYLKERKSKYQQKSLHTTECSVNSELMDAAHKKNIDAQDKLEMLLTLLEGKIKVIVEYLWNMESKVKALTNCFSCFSSEYECCPGGRQTSSWLHKLKVQFAAFKNQKKPSFQHKLTEQIHEIRFKLREYASQKDKKAQQERNLMRLKMEQQKKATEERLQQSIDTVNYNNFIISKLHRGDNDKITQELSKYRQLRRNYNELQLKNQRLRSEIERGRRCRSALKSKDRQEDEQTAVEDVSQE